MGVGKTIYTVSGYNLSTTGLTNPRRLQVINAVEDAPQILAQVQSIVIPPIVYTLQNKQLGSWSVVEGPFVYLTIPSQTSSQPYTISSTV